MQVLLSKGTPWHERNKDALLSTALQPYFHAATQSTLRQLSCAPGWSCWEWKVWTLKFKPRPGSCWFCSFCKQFLLRFNQEWYMAMTRASSCMKNVLTALGNHPEFFMFFCSWTVRVMQNITCGNCHPIKLSGCLFWQGRLNWQWYKTQNQLPIFDQ